MPMVRRFAPKTQGTTTGALSKILEEMITLPICESGQGVRLDDAEQPEYEQEDKDGDQSAAAVVRAAVVETAATKQNEEDDNENN
jgi:hypothetical protein